MRIFHSSVPKITRVVALKSSLQREGS